MENFVRGHHEIDILRPFNSANYR